MSDNNLKLWNAVCETNPEHTRPVKKGGYQFTAICSQYQIKSATEQFGPYGGAWGLKNIQRDLSLLDKYEIIIISAIFFYPGGEFEISTSQNIWISKSKGKLDDDFCKKSETDLLTKSLSKIGFNADVFMGRFDDNKYIQEMNEKFSKPVLVNNEQVNNIRNMLKVYAIEESWMCEQWQIGCVEEIHQTNFDTCLNWLKNVALEKNKLSDEEIQRRAENEIGRQREQRNNRRRERERYEKQQQQQAVTVNKAITPAQVKEILDSLAFIGLSEQEFFRVARIDQIGQLDASRYDQAIEWIMNQPLKTIDPDEQKLNDFIDAAQTVVQRHHNDNQTNVVQNQPKRQVQNVYRPAGQQSRRDYDRQMFAEMASVEKHQRNAV